jgi:hypothetical protein
LHAKSHWPPPVQIGIALLGALHCTQVTPQCAVVLHGSQPVPAALRTQPVMHWKSQWSPAQHTAIALAGAVQDMQLAPQ